MTDEARLQRWLNGQRRSHQRTFQSREMVWSSLESMARENGVAMDQLIAEAMEAYAEQRGYRVPDDPPEEETQWATAPRMQERQPESERDPLEETRDAPGLTDLDRSYMPPAAPPVPATPRRPPPSFNSTAGWDDDNDLARTETRDAVRRRDIANAARSPALDIKEPGDESRTSPRYPRAGEMPGAGGSGIGQSTGSRPTHVSPLTAPMPAAVQRPIQMGPAAGGGLSRSTRPLQPPLQPPGTNRASAPPPLRPSQPEPMRAPPPPARDPMRDTGQNKPLRDTGSNAALKRLVLTHQGRQVEVDKERFVLGRSKTQADLRLEDPNVSRQHAAIERVGPAFYIVDLGSTNGIFVSGQKVTRRALADGDLIVITSHEIRCALR